MKYMLTMLAALVITGSAIADTYTAVITSKGSLTELSKFTRTINNSTDKVTFTGTALVKMPGGKLEFSGPHMAYTDNGALAGTATYSGGGSGGGGGGGKLEGPTQLGYLDEYGNPQLMILAQEDNSQTPDGFMGRDFKFHFNDNITGSWTTYIINLPMVSGNVYFVGNSATGFQLNNYDSIKVGTFLIGSGPKAPTQNSQLMKSQP